MIFLHVAKSCRLGDTGATLPGCWDKGDVVSHCPGCAQTFMGLLALRGSWLPAQQVKGSLHPQLHQPNVNSQLCLDFKGLVGGLLR